MKERPPLPSKHLRTYPPPTPHRRSQRRQHFSQVPPPLPLYSTASSTTLTSATPSLSTPNATTSPMISTTIAYSTPKKAKKTCKIILKDDVSELGKKGQLLEVKMGFFCNYLLPLGKAQIVTPLLIKEMWMEEERIEAEKKRVSKTELELTLWFGDKEFQVQRNESLLKRFESEGIVKQVFPLHDEIKRK